MVSQYREYTKNLFKFMNGALFALSLRLKILFWGL